MPRSTTTSAAEAITGQLTETEAIADLADAASRAPAPIDIEKIHAVVLSDGAGGQRVEIVDLEKHLAEPRRKTGTFKPADVESFSDYVADHLDQDGTTVWIDRGRATLTAIINDHRPTLAGWGDHQAVLQLERTPEWTHWKSRDGQLLEQNAFAEHIQQGLDEIVTPEPALMLEIAQSLQGHTSADWKQARRLDNGETSITYTEAVEATAGRAGSIEIPDTFTLRVVPFFGEEPQEVTARLRYRVREGTLVIGYQLVRPHEVELTVLGEIRERLATRFDRVYMGQHAGGR